VLDIRVPSASGGDLVRCGRTASCPVAALSRRGRHRGRLAVEAVNDIDAVQVDPYWTSRVNALAVIGYSAGAGAVLVVLAYRDVDGDVHGMTAWPATGRALRLYTDGRTS
jgi:hypothetical protein